MSGVACPLLPRHWLAEDLGLAVVWGEAGKLLPHSDLCHDWQLGDPESRVPGLVDYVFNVKLYRMLLTVRGAGVIQENKMSHFFQRAVGSNST